MTLRVCFPAKKRKGNPICRRLDAAGFPYFIEQTKNSVSDTIIEMQTACGHHLIEGWITGLSEKQALVHLSSDVETAKKIGSRHGRPVIYRIDCAPDGKGRLPLLSLSQSCLTDKGSAGPKGCA